MDSLMELCERLERRGFTEKSFYHSYRDMCAPPMMNILSSEFGDLWYYNNFNCPILACVGRQTLIVMYAPGSWSLERIETFFCESHQWLLGNSSSQPKPQGAIKFAACEEIGGDITIREIIPGDWDGLINRRPLPSFEQIVPLTWDPEATA